MAVPGAGNRRLLELGKEAPLKKYKFHIEAAGRTTATIMAASAEDARDLYESGRWKSDVPNWDHYEVTEVEVFDETGKQIDEEVQF